MPPKIILTDEQKERVRFLYCDKSISASAIVRETGLSNAAVRSHLKTLGLSRPSGPIPFELSEAQKAEALDRYSRCRNARTVAKEMNLPGYPVYRFLQSANVFDDHTLSGDQWQAVQDLYLKEKLGVEAVAKQLGLPKTTVRRYLVDHGLNRPVPDGTPTHQERETVERLFQEGKGREAIVRETGIADSRVRKCLAGSGLRRTKKESKQLWSEKRKSTDIVPESLRPEVDRLYAEGYGLRAISEKVTVSEYAVRKHLRLNGLLRNFEESCRRSSERRETKSNLDFFEAVDTPEKAYWLGFIFADGNVSKNGRVLTIGLHRKDHEHLETFARIFGVGVSKYVFKPTAKSPTIRECSFVRVASTRLVADLNAKGILAGKSKIDDASVTDFIPLEFRPHFIRGFMDGDGHVGMSDKTGLRVGFCGCLSLMNWIESVLRLEAGASERKVTQSTSIWTVSWTGKSAARILDYLYRDATVALPRKKAIYDAFLAERSGKEAVA